MECHKHCQYCVTNTADQTEVMPENVDRKKSLNVIGKGCKINPTRFPGVKLNKH